MYFILLEITKTNKCIKRKNFSWSDEKKAQVSKILVLNMMSSEDETDDGYEIRPLRFRSQRCNDLLEKLDEKSKSLSSTKARKQTAKRTMGSFSQRAAPDLGAGNDWAIKNV